MNEHLADDEWTRKGLIKCEGGWRHPAYPNEPPFTDEELRRFEEVEAKMPPPKRKSRRRR
jgi:hypothetical protein